MNEREEQIKAKIAFRIQEPHICYDGSVRMTVFCQLCQNRPASDLHHIISRAHVATKYQHLIPEEYHAMLCNRCNLNNWFIKADSAAGRRTLILSNVKFYGAQQMMDSLRRFYQLIPFQPGLFSLEDIFESEGIEYDSQSNEIDGSHQASS